MDQGDLIEASDIESMYKHMKKLERRRRSQMNGSLGMSIAYASIAAMSGPRPPVMDYKLNGEPGALAVDQPKTVQPARRSRPLKERRRELARRLRVKHG